MAISDESVRELRRILRKDLNKNISVKQARRFGEWILKFYSHLSENKKGTGVNDDGDQELSTGTTNKNSN